MKRTACMRFNLDFKFFLSELDSESELEVELQYELKWELECNDLDIPTGISEQEDSEDEVQILKPPHILVVDLINEDEIEPLLTLLKEGRSYAE
jgi:hypothetical protein